MAPIPQPPAPGRKLLDGSEPLKGYHGAMAPFFEQIRAAFEGLALGENFGGVVTEPFTVTAGVDGALTGVFVAAGFAPLVVFFRAEEIDSAKRPTGSFVGGSAQWSTTPRTAEQGFQVMKAPGLRDTISYSVTFIALPG